MTRQRDIIRITSPMTPRARMLREVESIAHEHLVEPREILGPSRERPAVRARQDCWSRLRRQGLSYTQIARMFGRDHTTIMYGVRRWEKGQ